MSKLIYLTFLTAVLMLAAVQHGQSQSFSDIQGRWTLTRTIGGTERTQTVEFKDQKFTYQQVTKEGASMIYARGTVTVKNLGPFSVITLTDIEGGDAKDDLQPIDDDRNIVYTRDEDKLILAMNFDKSREGERTECLTYKKAVN